MYVSEVGAAGGAIISLLVVDKVDHAVAAEGCAARESVNILAALVAALDGTEPLFECAHVCRVYACIRESLCAIWCAFSVATTAAKICTLRFCACAVYVRRHTFVTWATGVRARSKRKGLLRSRS